MRGVVNIHGKLAAVLDLALFSGAGTVTNGSNLLLLSCPDTSLALIVEQMERIISSEEIISREAGDGPLEQARLILSDGPVSLIDIEALLDGIERVLKR
jgi:chemotaxis signal transduction protein